MANRVTLLELVTRIAARAATDDEIIAIAVRLVNSGAVVLCGNFRDSRFDASVLASGA